MITVIVAITVTAGVTIEITAGTTAGMTEEEGMIEREDLEVDQGTEETEDEADHVIEMIKEIEKMCDLCMYQNP